MLNVIYSNRTEILLEALLEILAEPSSSPLAPQHVVVPGAAIGRWLTLRIAERFGICTNVRFHLPAQFIWQALRVLVPKSGSDISGFVPEINAWRLFRLLPRLAGAPGFEPVDHYLADADERQRYELATEIAGCFDRYLVFRPDWVREWERGGSGHWQAKLWRELVGEGQLRHWVHAYDAFPGGREPGKAEGGLPARIAVFGVHALSPSYLEILNALSSRLTLHLLQLNPCREFWGDIIAPRTQAKLVEEGSALADHAETGNALLASMGRHGRDFVDAIIEITDQADDRYSIPAEPTLLARVQRDLLELRDAGAAEPEVGGDTASGEGGDGSIAVHSCHSPLREVQVLHDQLLAMFERWPDLGPGDIVVMMPDIERYAPAVTAVFGTAPEGCHIPYYLSDAHAPSGDRIAAVFLELLALGDDRFDAQRVLAPLDLPAVRRRFELSGEECERIRDWVRESGIRWGVDASMRGALGLPASGEHTWQHGFDRLLLGHALPRADMLFGGLFPCDGAEGTRARTLGKLLRYYDALLACRAQAQATRSAGKWAALLRQWIATMLLADEGEEDSIDELLAAIAALEQEVALAGVTEPLSAAVIGMRLEQLLGADRSGVAAVRGAVTFGSLSALPGVPSPVICLLGMDGDRFPRNPPKPDFDLMAASWRRGDRSRREEDRYLFLLALLSARRCLYLSYVGQDLHDNSSIPPSVLIDELLDYIDGNPRRGDGGARRDALLVKHPLQPFSARYFDGADARRFSYRPDNCIAPADNGAGIERPAFIAQPLPPADEQWTQLGVDDLLAFYRHPARFLLQRRLRIDLSVHAQELECSEPFDLPPREAAQIRKEWLARVQRGVSLPNAHALMRAGGLLPHGPVGDLIVGDEAAAAQALRVRALSLGDFSATGSAQVDIALGRFRLSGQLTEVAPDGLMRLTAGKLFESLRLEFWLRHLILHCVTSREPPRRSVCVAAEEAFSLSRVSEPAPLLTQLLEDYWRGLHLPLRFFPRSAYAYQRAVHRGQDPRAALRKAQKCWRGNDHAQGEGDDPYYRVLFNDSEPLDAEFAALAQRIYGPLLAHTQAL